MKKTCRQIVYLQNSNIDERGFYKIDKIATYIDEIDIDQLDINEIAVLTKCH